MGHQFEFRQVPPPARAPIQSKAKELGLLPGLKVSPYRMSVRCGCCNKQSSPDEEFVWVPDSVRSGDSVASVIESGRRNAYNGEFGSWCISCAQKLGSPAKTPAALNAFTTIATAEDMSWLAPLAILLGIGALALGLVLLLPR